MNPHEEFLELCAASTAGELTKEERRKLDEHLSGCASCREALRQFQETVKTAVPAIAAGLPQNDPPPVRSWSQDKAETALFERLSKEVSQSGSRKTTKDALDGTEPSHHRAYFPSQFDWKQMWMSYAAAILLFLALAISAYRVGIRRGVEITANAPASQGKESNLFEEQLSDLRHDRETLRAQLAARDKSIADLKQQVEALRVTESEQVRKSAAAQNEQVRHLGEAAANANARISDLESKLNTEEKARADESFRAAALEAKLGELTQQLQARDETIAVQKHRLESREGALEQQQAKLAEQKELLDHDRDIRELMGARDLYIAEVRDVAKDGATQKSYGRVFFTKGKSLIFYAYDLDRQPGLKNASTFQAWGQRGTDRAQALNLGIFYEDNASKKCWILKFDDPQKLEEIDAVFVTVEPNGGSHKPSGKPFLFAYLKVNPNHP
ncbi:MAG TPA: zf-HC2 domain-containing protein [Candidatus Eisenbacteria bacterium]|nr:zf-HC2 domain-containing protein [Candidatus Eisenbacteria bacterium]